MLTSQISRSKSHLKMIYHKETPKKSSIPNIFKPLELQDQPQIGPFIHQSSKPHHH